MYGQCNELQNQPFVRQRHLHIRIRKVRAIAQRLGRLEYESEVRVDVSLPSHHPASP